MYNACTVTTRFEKLSTLEKKVSKCISGIKSTQFELFFSKLDMVDTDAFWDNDYARFCIKYDRRLF